MKDKPRITKIEGCPIAIKELEETLRLQGKSMEDLLYANFPNFHKDLDYMAENNLTDFIGKGSRKGYRISKVKK